ncbi:MAG: hypothetical protein ABJL73_17125, partial [Lentilitoribacter sp.]
KNFISPITSNNNIEMQETGETLYWSGGKRIDILCAAGRETILFLIVFYLISNFFLMLRIVINQIIQKRRLGR